MPEKSRNGPQPTPPQQAAGDPLLKAPPASRNPLNVRVARRAFLTGSTAVAAAAGYGALAPDAPENAPAERGPSDPRKVTYRETDHIRQFYARARF